MNTRRSRIRIQIQGDHSKFIEETTMMWDHGLRRLEEYNDSDLLDSESDSDDTIVRTNNISTITSYTTNYG